MTIELNILDNLDAIEDFYTNRVQEIAGPAVKAAMNKTLRTARKESLDVIHTTIHLNSRIKTKSAFGKENVKIFKAKGLNAFDMTGSLYFSGKALPMLWFIKGDSSNIIQKGVKISKRKKVKASIYYGKKFVVKKAFIQTHKSKQLFKRDGNKKLIKQGIPSLAEMVGKNNRLLKTIQRRMIKQFGRELKNQISFRLEKAAKKASTAHLKKHR